MSSKKQPPWTELYGTDVKNEEINYEKVDHDITTIIIIIMAMRECFTMYLMYYKIFSFLEHRRLNDIGVYTGILCLTLTIDCPIKALFLSFFKSLQWDEWAN